MKIALLPLAFLTFLVSHAAPLKIAYSDWPGWVAWDIAVKNGWLKDAGVDVEFVWLDYGASIEAFSGGKADGVMITNGDALSTTANGAKNVIIMLTDYSNGNDMLIAGPAIKNVADLKGKKIALELGLVEHLLLLNALKKADINETDVKIVNTPTSKTPGLFAAGQVDAIGAWQPTAGEALKALSGAHAIYTSADEPGLIYDALAVSPESLGKRRNDWIKLLSVWDKIVRYIRNPVTKENANAIMSLRSGSSPEDFSRYLSGTRFLMMSESVQKMTASGTSGYGSLKYSCTLANAFNLKYGVYKTSQDITACYDVSLASEAVAAGKSE